MQKKHREEIILDESLISLICINFITLCLVLGKFEVKCKGKKMERKKYKDKRCEEKNV